jgi:hypothetical protein
VHVLVALVDLVEGVLLGDLLVELEVALLVEPKHLQDVGVRVRAAEHRPLDLLGEEGQLTE